ncbi:unnamed protein product [Arabis nemorensis]|uniref:TF-B3 domain-containing protein n=1 Tax=Arabis nemorensis TaxID=586526 RepID=A0A565B283_9BRAS|nr:unnamed protein product [Arabis nemorensis]
MEKNRACTSQEPQKNPQDSSSPSNETEISISDVPIPPAKKIRTTSMSQEQRVTPRDSSFSPSNETEKSISDVTTSPANKIGTTSMSQEQRETTQDSSFSPPNETEMSISDVLISPAKNNCTEQREISKESSSSPSNGTEMIISDVPTSPAKNIGSNTSQEQRETTQDSSKETELVLFGVSMTPGKKSRTKMRQEQRETFQEPSLLPSKETKLVLFGVMISPVKQEQREIHRAYLFLASKEMKMPLTGISISPAKSMSQEPREIPNEYLLFPSKETEMDMSLSSASPMDIDEDLKKTGSLEDTEKGFVSTNLCLYDETWLPGNPSYPKVTCAPRDDEFTKQQARKMKEMRFLSKEQREEEKLYGVTTELTLFTDPWIIKKEMKITDIRIQLSLSKPIVESYILKYLSEDDQKNKFRQGSSEVTVNVYDTDTHTTHKMLLRSGMNRYCLKKSWRSDFVNRRGLKIGDEVGFFWDHSRSTLNFRVLSRAITDELKL